MIVADETGHRDARLSVTQMSDSRNAQPPLPQPLSPEGRGERRAVNGSQPFTESSVCQATQRKASLTQTAGAVFWSFFGVRRGRDHAADVAHLNPVHVIIMGVIGAAIFIGILITIVHLVVGK